jgi:hypothetical protein
MQSTAIAPALTSGSNVAVRDRECGSRIRRNQTCIRERQLLTPVTLTFDSEADYNNFRSGDLKASILLINSASQNTIGFAPNQVRSVNFGDRVNAGRVASIPPEATQNEARVIPFKGTITVQIVVDNFATPIATTQGQFEIALLPEGEGRDFGISLTYVPSEVAPQAGNTAPTSVSESCGTPIKGVIVKGGRNPGGNIAIDVGQSEIVTRRAAVRLEESSSAGTIILVSSKGVDPKSPGF